MRLFCCSYFTPLCLIGKYQLEPIFSAITNQNSYAFYDLPKHIKKMKKSKLNVDEWVGQKWLTVKEVCEILAISKSTFYKWRQVDRAPQTRRLPNGDLRIREDWLSVFLADLPEDAF